MATADSVNRRRFLRDSAAALSLSAASYTQVRGANDRVRIGLLGCGARAQAHIHVLARLPGVSVGAVCDVWAGHAADYTQTWGGQTTRRRYHQGRIPSALACGLSPTDATAVTTDYRRVLDRADVDAVCISTPDHWHARMTLDAVAAGKHVLCEPPAARTPQEIAALTAALARTDRVVACAEPTLMQPGLHLGRELIRAGRIGAATHLSAAVFRADDRGEWRYLRVLPEMNRQTIDWDLFLGHKFSIEGEPVGPSPTNCPFDPVTFAQWRCNGAFSAGPLSEWLTRPTLRLLFLSDARHPKRVAAAGGLFHDHDGRTVPDTVSVVADFDTAHLNLTASTCAVGADSEIVRGQKGAICATRHAVTLTPHQPAGGAPTPAETLTTSTPQPDTEAVWADFLTAIRGRTAPVGAPTLALAAAELIATAHMQIRG